MNLMTPHPARAPADPLTYAVADCALGKLLVARSAAGVCAILLGDHAEELAADLARRFPGAALIATEAGLGEEIAQIRRLLSQPSEGPTLTLDPRGTVFQRRVWQMLQSIPAGQTVSYAELAHRLGGSAHPRAVAGACAANPLALAIPCHRVIRANGDLAGYRWGLARKQALLAREARA